MPNVDTHAPGTPSWVDLMTPDPEGARKFYGALFGWTFAIGGPETGHYTMALLAGRNVAGIGRRPDDAPFPSVWTTYLASANVDADVARITKLGGQIMMPPMDVVDAGRMAIAIDPTGAAFGLWQAKQHHGAQVTGEPGAMTWHEVATRDAERARDFYANLFDLGSKKLPMALTYFMLERGGQSVSGVMQMNEQWPAEIPPHWMPYFAVKDTDAFAKQAEALGGKIGAQPFDTPYGRIAVISDPFGAHFSIVTEPKG
jgi:predicted enzyme related to lactoylglutathione lyase